MPPPLHLATFQTDKIDTNVNYPNIEFENLGANDDFVKGTSSDTAVDG